MNKIDRLIINSPYSEPKQHWDYNSDTRSFSLAEGRRKAGYIIASELLIAFNTVGIFTLYQTDMIKVMIKFASKEQDIL